MSYTVGERYWVPDEEHAWLAGTLKEFKNAAVDFQTEKGQRKFRVTDLKAKLEPCGSHVDDNVENLVDLDELSEGAILHHIRKRFAKKIIYTHVGSILVAVNPFENLPIYSEKDIQKAYTSTQLYPHVFCTASLAYSQLKMNRKNQSVLISGESGAGKTETTKKVLTFLASVASPPHSHNSQQVGIETKILQSNPLLEALGNAKTLRNNNSSRFGKWMKVGFNDGFTIQGCEIINYLLEKSRVVSQSTNERNYHIFYQLIAGATKEMKSKYHLRKLEEYSYLNQSGCMVIDGVNDADEFQDVLQAMKTLEFSNDIIDNIFKVISSILLLGNLQYELRSKEKDDACITERSENEFLQTIMSLLEVDPILFKFALTEKRVQMGRGSVVTLKLNISQSIDCRDTVAKTLYSHLFDWTIQQVNETLKPGDGMTSKAIPFSIGILDIFGFEVFDVNSFEQLCINFANEKLQQHFNDVIFQEEMKMYVEEGISLQQIQFEDNQPCVALIENKPYGILALLEEECSLGNATDLTFINKLDKTFGNVNTKATYNKYFIKNKVKPDCFSIAHFAGQVEYNVTNFLEKNKDNLSITIKEVMLQSTNTFLRNLFVIGENLGNPDSQAEKSGGGGKGGRKGAGGAASSKSTLGSQFRNQLIGLVTTLRETEPHFIRCVKPNHQKVSQVLDGHLALRQMKYAGLFEAIRIRQSGYAYRMSHQVFLQQYHILVPMLQKRVQSKELTYYEGCGLLQEYIISNNLLHKERMHLGTASKIFFKSTSDRIPLEQAKQSKIVVYVVKIQRQVKQFLNYLYYAKEMILLKKEKQKVEEMRNLRGKAVKKIQALWRGFAIRRMLSSMKDFFALRKALKMKKIPVIKDILYRIDKEFNLLSQQQNSDGDNETVNANTSPKKTLASIWDVSASSRQKKVAAKANAMKTAVFKLFAHEIKVGKVMLKLLEIQDTFVQDLQVAVEKHDVSKLNQLLLKSERLELTTHPLVVQAKELVYSLYEKRNVMKEILSFLTQFQDPSLPANTSVENGSLKNVQQRDESAAAGGMATSFQNSFVEMSEEDVQRLLSKAKAANIPQEFLDKVSLVYANISPRLKTRNKLRFAIETMNRYEIEQNVQEILQIRLHYHLFAEVELRAARMILQWLQWNNALFSEQEANDEDENDPQTSDENDPEENPEDGEHEFKAEGRDAKPKARKNNSMLLWGQPVLKEPSGAKLPPEFRELCQAIFEATFPAIKQMHEKRLQAAVEYNVQWYYEIIRCFKLMKTVCVWRYPEVVGNEGGGGIGGGGEPLAGGSERESNPPETPVVRQSSSTNQQGSTDFFSFRLSEAISNPYIIKSLHPDFDIYLQQSYSANMDAALSNLELSSSMHATLQQLDLMQEIDKEIVLPNGQRYFKTVTKNPRYHDKYGDGRGTLGQTTPSQEVDYEGMNIAGMGMTGLTATTTSTTVGVNSRLLQSTVSNSGKKVSYTLKPGTMSSMTPVTKKSSTVSTPGKTPRSAGNTLSISTTPNSKVFSASSFQSPTMMSPSPRSPSSPGSTSSSNNQGEPMTATMTRRRSFLPPNMPVKIVENLPPSSLEKQLHTSRVNKEKELRNKMKDRNHEIRYVKHSNWK